MKKNIREQYSKHLHSAQWHFGNNEYRDSLIALLKAEEYKSKYSNSFDEISDDLMDLLLNRFIQLSNSRKRNTRSFS